jgi:[acyl-carrier-protein] S-malonyltransferase
MWVALFPGQGSQSVGMGKILFENFPVARETFEEASDILKVNFKRLCFEGPESDLQLTENTQPALLVVSITCFRVVASVIGVHIEAASGHSVGEYAALVTSGVFKFAEALKAVRTRGLAMQQAVPVGQGGMAAVMGLSDEQVVFLCHWAERTSGILSIEPANFNAPGQVVISGSQKLLDWMKANVRAEEIFAPDKPRLKIIPLSVSAPFHCRLMKPAEDRMREVLSDIHFEYSQWPIVQNFSAEPTTDGDMMRENLIRQVCGPVRWTQCMARLKSMGATRMIEFGSGKVLSGLAKKIDSEGPLPFNINGLDDLKTLGKAIKGSVD